MDFRLLGSRSLGAKFGAAIENIGDMNRDSYEGKPVAVAIVSRFNFIKCIISFRAVMKTVNTVKHNFR